MTVNATVTPTALPIAGLNPAPSHYPAPADAGSDRDGFNSEVFLLEDDASQAEEETEDGSRGKRHSLFHLSILTTS
jgi:hypothetical protein